MFNSTTRRSLLRGLVPLVLAVGLTAGPSTVGFAAEAEVAIDNFAFTPAAITVTAGTKITFRNGDDIPHTVVATNKDFRSKPLDPGDTFSFTFEKPGTIEYFCG